jgi:hypothetical protein
VASEERAAEAFGPDLAPEYRALVGRVAAQREQAERLRALAERVEEQTARDERLLQEMEELLGLAPQMRMEALNSRLRGQRLQEIAIEVLRQQVGSGQEIHYRDWYLLLLEAGYQVGGKDPLATFLVQVHRAPHVERVGRRTGKYRLVTA